MKACWVIFSHSHIVIKLFHLSAMTFFIPSVFSPFPFLQQHTYPASLNINSVTHPPICWLKVKHYHLLDLLRENVQLDSVMVDVFFCCSSSSHTTSHLYMFAEPLSCASAASINSNKMACFQWDVVVNHNVPHQIAIFKKRFKGEEKGTEAILCTSSIWQSSDSLSALLGSQPLSFMHVL